MPDNATLIVGPSWVGDMVMAQSLFLYLKQASPERPLDVLAPDWSLPIVARMPEIRRGIAAATGHGELGIGKRRSIGRELRGRYDRAIVLPRSFKAALVPFFANIPRRTGFRGELRYGLINDRRKLDRGVLDQTVKRFLALGHARNELIQNVPFPGLEVSEANQQRLVERLDLQLDQPVVAMMPGAEYGPAKCWPLENFAELARELATDGFAVWVLGGEKDGVAGAAIAGQSPALNLCGKSSLEDVIDLLALARHAVSNDSGLMHVAAAVGTHVHAIYGSSSPVMTPPLTTKRNIHFLDIECSPCFKRECPLEHLRCLREISVQQLRAAID